MRPRTSSMGRNTSASVTVTVTVSGTMEICPVSAQYILITPILIKTMSKSINNVRRDHIIRQTVPYRNYPASIVKFS